MPRLSHHLYFHNVSLFVVKIKLTSLGKTQITIPWFLKRPTVYHNIVIGPATTVVDLHVAFSLFQFAYYAPVI